WSITRSSMSSRPSSARIESAAEVKALVMDAMENSVSASTASGLPASRWPQPPANTTSPSLTTATALPGTRKVSRTDSTCASRPASGSGAWCAAASGARRASSSRPAARSRLVMSGIARESERPVSSPAPAAPSVRAAAAWPTLTGALCRRSGAMTQARHPDSAPPALDLPDDSAVPPVDGIRTGIGGWVYAPWRGNFYPKGLVQRRELEYASRRLSAIEINGTYYGAQKPATYARWRDETPPGFVFSAKAPKRITQSRALARTGAQVEDFIGGIATLGDRLGPLVWQFDAGTRID